MVLQQNLFNWSLLIEEYPWFGETFVHKFTNGCVKAAAMIYRTVAEVETDSDTSLDPWKQITDKVKRSESATASGEVAQDFIL